MSDTMPEEMIEVEIDTDEWYPVYDFSRKDKTSRWTVAVPASAVERWERVKAEFDVCQDEMRELGKGIDTNGR